MNTKNIIICDISISIFIISNHIIITMTNGHLTLGWLCSSVTLARKLERPLALRGEPNSARSCAYRAPHGDVSCLGWVSPCSLNVGHLALESQGGPIVLGSTSAPKLNGSCVTPFYWVLMNDFKYFNFYHN
jgi:hypothetical protein